MDRISSWLKEISNTKKIIFISGAIGGAVLLQYLLGVADIYNKVLEVRFFLCLKNLSTQLKFYKIYFRKIRENLN